MISCQNYGFWNLGVGRYGGWGVQIIISVPFLSILSSAFVRSVGLVGPVGSGLLALCRYSHASFFPPFITAEYILYVSQKSRERELRACSPSHDSSRKIQCREAISCRIPLVNRSFIPDSRGLKKTQRAVPEHRTGYVPYDRTLPHSFPAGKTNKKLAQMPRTGSPHCAVSHCDLPYPPGISFILIPNPSSSIAPVSHHMFSFIFLFFSFSHPLLPSFLPSSRYLERPDQLWCVETKKKKSRRGSCRI